MVEVQVLQVTAEQRNRSNLVVGQLQVQQGGYIEHILWKTLITQLIAVQPHKRKVSKVFEVISKMRIDRRERQM